MPDETTLEDDIRTLYRRAFEQYGSDALWNARPSENPSTLEALAITRALRTHGGMDGRRLAEEIERLCRAAHETAVPCSACSGGRPQL